ncbi:aminotransferase class III-fold pyridoxal phosphate-dependent enzyme [Aquabacterium sp. OR-4]|uniref:aminotransferase class III-fold pyridoxal phosphate-dependent enzyme n=1 Tax=Aquabacterium sp. OR-4 TaxID=2978127 RepID=UPI0021B3FACA|nr:aminotransferase class III-fold pyridoxal phosphate-dependent enzyme [Aquabacterium sp. OR-4]MDT7835654.1 aminotransferase class III-fold pyridoxal phosphate-dependent enzyme [Aquabacterium sp. OR-4]
MRLGPRPPNVFVRGQGSWLWDAQGRRHLDAVQGWAVNTLGHAPPQIAQALARQAGLLLQAGPGFHNAPALALAERLAALSGLDRVFIGTSGAEANEGAVKLARKWGQQQRGGAATVISFSHSFHGRTLAMMAASGKPGFGAIFPPAVPGFVHCPYNQLAPVREAIGPDTVAVMLELLQGEAGVVAAEPAFVQGLRALCDEHGLLLIVDEVQTGIGRCGTLLAHTQFGITPDIVTLGKGLGGGVPIGAVLAREAVCRLAPGDQGGTYHGNALVCAAALAVLEVVAQPGFLAGVQARGEQLAAGLRALSSRHGLGAVHGRGLLRALALPPTLASGLVADAARTLPGDCGLLVNPAQPQRLRLMPALTISDGEIHQLLQLLDEALVVCTRPV